MIEHYLIAGLISYILGSVPCGFLIAKYKGIDIKKHGSGNIGATNVYRVVGKKEGILTLVLDVTKGILPVLVFSLIFPKDKYMSIVSASAAVLGHDYSIFLLFKGGKGVATSYGASLLINPISSLIGMFVWIGILITTKYSSLAALLSFLITALIALSSPNYLVRLYFLTLYAIILFKHRENIKRLFKREENRIKI